MPYVHHTIPVTGVISNIYFPLPPTINGSFSNAGAVDYWPFISTLVICDNTSNKLWPSMRHLKNPKKWYAKTLWKLAHTRLTFSHRRHLPLRSPPSTYDISPLNEQLYPHPKSPRPPQHKRWCVDDSSTTTLTHMHTSFLVLLGLLNTTSIQPPWILLLAYVGPPKVAAGNGQRTIVSGHWAACQ